MDRRKRKTRLAIQQAVAELLPSKGFESMTILDITEKADINRGTFYLHFVDKYDMLDQFEKELLMKIKEAVLEHLTYDASAEDLIATRYPTIVNVLRCIADEKQILEILFQTKGILSLQSQMKEVLLQLFKVDVVRNIDFKQAKVSPDFFVTILTSNFLGFAQYFLATEEEMEPEKLAKTMLNVLINGPARVGGLLKGNMINVDEIIEKSNLKK